MGGAFGLAICNAILNNVVKARLPPGIPDDVRRVIVHQISPDLPSSLDAATVDAIFDAYQDALRYIFIFFVPVVGVAFVSLGGTSMMGKRCDTDSRLSCNRIAP